MFDIEFICPHCKQSLVVEEAAAALVLQCPGCGKDVTVPRLPNARPLKPRIALKQEAAPAGPPTPLERLATSYPKSPRDIRVRIVHRTIVAGVLSPDGTTTENNLYAILSDYTQRLGYTSDHLSGLMIQLFTRGKVEVSFRDYCDRFELVNRTDRLQAAQAMAMLYDYLHGLTDALENESKFSQTQCIVVQPRKSAR